MAATQEAIDELVVRYENMVTAGKAVAPLASQNLAYWLSGKGGTLYLPSHHFQRDNAVVNHLRDKHRQVFLSGPSFADKGIIPRLKKQPAGGAFSMTWEDSMYAGVLTDLFYGLGGFTLRSTVEVTAQSISGVAGQYVAITGKQMYTPPFGVLGTARSGRVMSRALVQAQ